MPKLVTKDRGLHFLGLLAEECQQKAIEVLSCLSRHVPQPVASLSADARLPEGEIVEILAFLRRRGWVITGSSVKGYRLAANPEQLEWLEAQQCV